MSMDTCHRCDAPVDTDFDADCYQPDPRHSLKGFSDICICERCRERDAESVVELRGQFECPICGVATPHGHDPITVELERYARPAFEAWAADKVRHIGNEGIGGIGVHYGSALTTVWPRRDHNGRYVEGSVETAWQAYAAAWLGSDYVSRKPRMQHG